MSPSVPGSGFLLRLAGRLFQALLCSLDTGRVGPFRPLRYTAQRRLLRYTRAEGARAALAKFAVVDSLGLLAEGSAGLVGVVTLQAVGGGIAVLALRLLRLRQ